MRSLLMFIPPEFLVVMIAVAGLAMVAGARRLAVTLFSAAALMIFLPVLLAPLFDALPYWLLVVLMVFFGLSLVRTLFNLLIGKNSTDQMIGTLAADVVRALLLAPFRLLSWAAGAIFRRR